MFINMWVCNYGNESSLDWDKHLRLLLKFWGCVCMNIWAELLMLPLLARVCECVPALCVCVCVCVYGLSVKTAVLLLNGQEQQLQNSPNIKVKLQRERGTSWSQGVLLATADELTGGVCVRFGWADLSEGGQEVEPRPEHLPLCLILLQTGSVSLNLTRCRCAQFLFPASPSALLLLWAREEQRGKESKRVGRKWMCRHGRRAGLWAFVLVIKARLT